MKRYSFFLCLAVIGGCQSGQPSAAPPLPKRSLSGVWTGNIARTDRSQRYPDTITFDFHEDGKATVKLALTDIKFDKYDIAYATVQKEASWMLTGLSLRLRVLDVKVETTATGDAKRAFDKATPDIKRGEFEAMQYRLVKINETKMDFVDDNNRILHLTRQG